MTNQKQVLIVPQKPISIKSSRTVLTSQLNKTLVNYRAALSYINLKQWLLLLFLNTISFSFIALAYLFCAAN